MNNGNIETVLYNLSAVKYSFALVCETALDQLNHYFCTVGNGIDYDSVHGLLDKDYSRNDFFITKEHNFDFTPIQDKRKKSCDELQKQYDSMKEIFGENVPDQIKSLYVDEIGKLEKPFEVMDESYFFSYNDIAHEMIESVRKSTQSDRHNRLQIRTPSMIDEQYSIIYKVKSSDNPVMLKLALAMCKAWIVVLEYYVQAEWYFSEEEVQKYQGASYCYSLNYINTCIDTFKNIIEALEIHHD